MLAGAGSWRKWAPVSFLVPVQDLINCRYQAITRFDLWSLSAMAMFRQLSFNYSDAHV